MLERKVHFYSGPGLRLAGILALPDAATRPGPRLPTLVLCHGPGGYKDPDYFSRDHVMPAVSRWLTDAGYAALRFGYRGVGESEGPAYRHIPLEQVEDIRNTLTFLEQQPEVDPGRMGLFGVGTGAANATYCAGVDTRVKCLVAIHGMGDIGRWFRSLRRYWEWVELLRAIDEDRKTRVVSGESRMIKSTELVLSDPRTAQYVASGAQFKGPPRLFSLESAEAMSSFRPEEVVGRISPRAAMWLCAAGDTLTPNDESRSMYEKAGEPRKLVMLEGAIHHGLYQSPDFDRMMEHTLEWFNQHLK
jgi:alpha-beta hydrolase superfamily lysophospholipase